MREDVLTKEEVVKFFGSRIATAEALGITPQAVSLWGENVPPGRLAHVRLVMKLEAQKRAARKKRKAA